MATSAVSKAALVYLTRVLDLELRPLGIRVNAVAPALIDNSRNRPYLPPGLLAHAVAPRVIVDISVYLVSDADGQRFAEGSGCRAPDCGCTGQPCRSVSRAPADYPSWLR